LNSRFDQKKIIKLAPIKEYRDNAIEIELPNGKYAIVPSTLKPGMTGKFFMNVYFSCDKDAINLYKYADKKEDRAQFNVIAEEEETKLKYDDALKRALKVL
jgi:hypothetical protein